MSALSSFFPSKFLSSAAATSSSSSDPLSHLRFALETMPGSRKYVFTPATRAEILTALYDAFWGQYAHFFLPPKSPGLPPHALLGDIQTNLGLNSPADDPIVPGRACGRIFRKGESCFRCKDCASDDSCVLCARCFHATDHTDHNVSFFIAQQSGGCCDCGDDEAWRSTINCPYHPPQSASESATPAESMSFETPKAGPRPLAPAAPTSSTNAILEDGSPEAESPQYTDVPPELMHSMHLTVAYALSFVLNTLSYSPPEPTLPTLPTSSNLSVPSHHPQQSAGSILPLHTLHGPHAGHNMAGAIPHTHLPITGLGHGPIPTTVTQAPPHGQATSGQQRPPGSASSEAAIRLQPSADPMMKEDQYALVLWNDDKHSFAEVISLLCDGPTSAAANSSSTPGASRGRSVEEATALAHEIDTVGRATIELSANVPRLLDIAQGMSQIDLGVTVRRAYDTFREQVVGVIIEWLVDLTHARLIGFAAEGDPSAPQLRLDPSKGAMILREVVAQELLKSRRGDTSANAADLGNSSQSTGFSYGYIGIPGSAHSQGHFPGGPVGYDEGIELGDSASRLQWLFLYHTRLWKKPRLGLKEVYASVLSIGRDYKIAMASHFAQSYPPIVDAYLLLDREAETSIKYFALQLFTVPSVALHVSTQHRLVEKLLAIIESFFLGQIRGKKILTAFSPSPSPSGTSPSVEGLTPLPSKTGPLDVDSAPFKSKRFMPIFSDLRYLAHTPPLQALIASYPATPPAFCSQPLLTSFMNTCQLFMCLNPNRRLGSESEHVEYETDAWISVFNVALSLSRVIRVYGEAFGGGRATTSGLISAIKTVIHKILLVCTLADVEERLDRVKYPAIEFHEVVFGASHSISSRDGEPGDDGGKQWRIVKFDVLEGWVSFHHPLHWLLAELFKHVNILSTEALTSAGGSTIRDIVGERVNEQAILTVVDFPLRVLAMVAQIRTGLWVRNGFAIRGQLLHYRDYMLRELCYDQDIYVLQVAFTLVSDPAIILISILDRFGLLHYFSGAPVHSTYDPTQLGSMVEELLYVLITILSENAHASGMSVELAARREIVHALAMGACSYTDLVKRVSERLTDHVCFDRVLREVASFRAPETVTDTGLYELKDESYDEVNPFFYHYTRNKREEVENVLKTRLRKKANFSSASPDPVIVPKPFGVTTGPFVVIPKLFEFEVLLQIMFYGVRNILIMTEDSGSPPSSAEAILDQTLHLIMLAIIEKPQSFSHLSAAKSFEENRTLIDVVCALEQHDKYKPYRARCAWILDRLAEQVPAEVERRRATDSARSKVDPEDQKKKAAKARQEAIMRQMKAQQASFAHNFDEVDEDEDDIMAEESAQEQVSYGTCIVCQEELNGTRAFGMLGLVQPSRFIRRHPDTHNTYLNEVLLTPSSLDRATPSNQPNTFPPPKADFLDSKARGSPNFEGFPAAATRFGLHGSVCSHLMHLDCFQVYSISIRQRHRAQATRNHPESIPRKEYICPLCKSLGNVILPVANPTSRPPSTTPFPDWIRAAGIGILKSKPDPHLDSLQFRNGTGEFVFWSAQDPGYGNALRMADRQDTMETPKMVDTVMAAAKTISSQSRHLRERQEPEQGERGAGIYLPEELLGYTICVMEIGQRGSDSAGGLAVDSLSESQTRMINSLLTCLAKLAALHFRGRPDEGRDAIRQAIIKRLLPEWSRTSLTPFSYPLLLRDPFTVLVETAAVAPEMLRHVLVLTYYACLARTVIGLVYVLNKTRSYSTTQIPRRNHQDLFGDIRMFFMSVVRHSPVFEHTATLVFETFGEGRIEKLMYAFTLPFLRRAAILCRSASPNEFQSPPSGPNDCEYSRLLAMLGIPPLSSLPNHDTLQNALSGWCAHYGHSHAASQLNCGVVLDYPGVYRLARLPLVLDNLFGEQEKALTCPRCNTVPLDAAICLFCGVTVCMQSHCCIDAEGSERGECNMHTRECGGVIGMYFLVKRCSLLYLYANNGTFAQSPYLDAHGEVDISMRRGRRQYLHHARWEDVRKTWLSHGIPTAVARKLESTVDSGGWETL
ncbi:hypothetical protein HGRIS_007369 [Hohenbuehelia grisea]|uniref:E3 ubiquitin-protein ligase n=1 Tax=Hohenbuehelia grisea TaxID=104357 RepID=A0ABR3J4Z4_9AGAR